MPPSLLSTHLHCCKQLAKVKCSRSNEMSNSLCVVHSHKLFLYDVTYCDMTWRNVTWHDVMWHEISDTKFVEPLFWVNSPIKCRSFSPNFDSFKFPKVILHNSVYHLNLLKGKIKRFRGDYPHLRISILQLFVSHTLIPPVFVQDINAWRVMLKPSWFP